MEDNEKEGRSLPTVASFVLPPASLWFLFSQTSGILFDDSLLCSYHSLTQDLIFEHVRKKISLYKIK